MDIAILAGGDFPKKEFPLYLLRNADALICCDSALTTALRHGLQPEAVVGDFDSISKRTLDEFKGKKIHVSEQDDNDLTKTMDYVVGSYGDQISSITIFGASGKSEAHTMGNLFLLMEYEQRYGFWKRGITLQAVSDFSTMFAVPDSCSLNVGIGRKVSFIVPDQSLKIKSSGLKWPLDNVVFDNLWKATLNKAEADEILLNFSHPSPVLVILD